MQSCLNGAAQAPMCAAVVAKEAAELHEGAQELSMQPPSRLPPTQAAVYNTGGRAALLPLTQRVSVMEAAKLLRDVRSTQREEGTARATTIISRVRAARAAAETVHGFDTPSA